jgi:adenine/guanine phosphoribosyltransferase-like PRPP-binding protein
MKKEASIKQKLFAIELLRLLKDNYGYEEIRKLLKLPAPVISRYTNGHVLPSFSRTQQIIKIFKEKYFFEILRSKVKEVGENVYDLTPFIQDIKIQKLTAKMIFSDFHLLSVDKVATAAIGGVPLSALVAEEFGCDLVIATEKKEGVVEVLEEKAMYSPGVTKYIYIPKNSIKPNESVLIVDDITRTGLTLHTLIKLVEKSKGKVSGIVAVYEIDNILRKLKEKHKLSCEVKSYIRF